jgi:hypothetical protein
MFLHPLRQAQLSDVQGFGFGYRTDDGMECFAGRGIVDAPDSAGQLHDSVTRREIRSGRSRGYGPGLSHRLPSLGAGS